jgi:PQQ-like domain
MAPFGRSLLAALAALVAASSPSPVPGPDVLQFGAEPTSAIGPETVAQLQATWQVPIPEPCDGAPLFVGKVDIGGTLRDVVIVETNQGRVVVLNALSGKTIWQTTPPAGGRLTTSTPAVDPAREYVYAYCLDGYVHKYAIGDGREATGGGWPQLVTTKGDVEKGSSAIRIATAANGHTYLYMPTSAYPDPGDAGDYQGHVTTVDLDQGSQNVFNAACSDKAFHFTDTFDENDCTQQQSGIWARAGVVYDPSLDRVFVTTGNGVYDAASGGFNWGSSVVALKPDGSVVDGVPLDSYTPDEYQMLTDQDLDLSASAVEILPAGTSGIYPHLGVQIGKDGMLRLLNLADLSGQGGRTTSAES